MDSEEMTFERLLTGYLTSNQEFLIYPIDTPSDNGHPMILISSLNPKDPNDKQKFEIIGNEVKPLSEDEEPDLDDGIPF